MTKDVFIKEVRDAEAMLYHISKSILKNPIAFIDQYLCDPCSKILFFL